MAIQASRGSYARLVPLVSKSRPRLHPQRLLPTHRFSSTEATSVFPARYENTTTLPDGRTLAWAEAGNLDGHPIFFLHGFPGSRLEARGVEEIGKRHGIRFICPDRPGYGRSSFYPEQTIADWPGDMQSLANHLKLDRYGVFGGSGGGPYVLACAREIPSSKLSGVGVVCIAAPWEAGTRELQWYRHPVSAAATRTPGLLTKLLDSTLALLHKYAATEGGKKYLDAIAARAAKTAGKQKEVSAEAAQTPEAVAARRERFLRIFAEPFAGGTRGFVRDAYLLSHPWGFRLEDIRCDRRIQIWHGVRDVNSPIAMVRYMADRLPNCDLHELEGEDHFTIIKHLEMMLSKLVKT
ncbi:hypothetical protein PG994_013754 [Apiospora phragmitis]|uniref:AB hydrolase-1 domain-containing protein n=1 Tax=Apiospora phragmitis TaxID=2905665 RepID=A0ABR1T2S6_9PEZI